MIVPQASPGRIIVVLFWTKYAVRRQYKSNQEFSGWLVEEAEAIIALSLFLLASKKTAIIVSFP